MATDINKVTRKRKSTSDLIFEVDEADCSPPSSPEPVPESASCSVSETEAVSQASTDIISSVVTNDIKHEVRKPDVDLRCMDMDVDSSSPSPPDFEKPFLTLIFRDKSIANRHKAQIINFIKRMVNFSLDSESESDLKINLWENIYDYGNTVSPCINTFVETKNVDLFVVDTTPSKCREILPRYSPNRVIDELDPDKANGKLNDRDKTNYRPNTSCFNCDGNHAMKDCTEMKDYRRILAARNIYMSNAQAKNTRYHKDEEQKYKHLLPGKISDKLRRALDLRRHEIPPYVYQMRTLGYPPGWLQEALITDTRLEMFDFQGCVVNDTKTKHNMIDPSKVVEYPGFNVPLEEGFKDEYKYYRCPPYDEIHSKKTMLEYVKNMTASNDENQEQPTSKDEPSTPILAPPGCEESDANSQDSESKEPKTNRSESPTLTDLEIRKRQLLAELEDGSLNSPLATVTEKGDKSIVSDTTSPCVVSSAFGTPILKSASPYAQLPDRDKFSKDISQVINFENLPNATGKYEQMSKVISKVRGTVKTNVTAGNDKS